ncbi:MAG: glycosyltransferase [Phycisphaerales bacterium JB065]
MIWGLELIGVIGAAIALGAFVMTVCNLKRLPIPARVGGSRSGRRLCVGIPARNEAENIEACVRSVLGGGVEDVRVLVYDDQSDDGTTDIVSRLATEDGRVEVVPTEAMPAGWCGKQHACWRIARHAMACCGLSERDWLLFIDADVRIEPDGLRRTLAHTDAIDRDGKLGVLSTFPRQITRSLGETLLVTAIFFVLLSYLPFGRMRRTLSPAASAGCGQFMMVRCDCYQAFGGHEAIKDSMHDGVRLPRLARRSGFRTDLFDGADVACCRMYDGFGQAWRGFAKNAYEGLGSLGLLVFLTVLHMVGHIAPPMVFVVAVLVSIGEPDPAWLAIVASGSAVLLGVGQRLMIAVRERHSLSAAPLHSVSVALMTAVQWWSWYLDRTGRRSWRGRTLGEAGTT